MTGWDHLGLVMYVYAILNFCYAFYSYIRMDLINTIICIATYLILIYAVANIEKDLDRYKPWRALSA